MQTKKIIKYILSLFLLVTVVLILLGIRRNSGDSQLSEIEATSKGMVYSLFNNNNEKILALQCQESQRESRDRVLMKEIQATIFKGGQRKKDIHIYGESGYVANNMHNFTITGKARVFAKDFYLKSDNYSLKDRDVLTSQSGVDFKIESLTGRALAGMKVSLLRNYMLLYRVNGIFEILDNPFYFHGDTLKFRDDSRTVTLEKKASTQGPEAVLMARRIRMIFSEEYRHLREATATGRARFSWERDKGAGKEFWQIKSERIRNVYNSTGILKRTLVGENANIRLKDNKNSLAVLSSKIEIDFNTETNTISRVHCPVPSTISNKGKTNFEIKGSKATITYNKQGEIDNCYTRKGTTFRLNEYAGSTTSIQYDLKKESADLKGKDSLVRHKGYEFKSYLFHIDVKNNVISTDERVISVIELEKQNDLFSKDPIFVSANGLKIMEKSQSFKFHGDVNLLQKDVSLKADWFEIKDDNIMIATGNVILQFMNESKEMSIEGDSLVFETQKKDIEIKGKGILKNGDDLLKADWILIQFDNNSEVTLVSGNKNVIFSSDDYSGKSKQIYWQLAKGFVVFKESAQISKKGSGVAKGEDLRLDLKAKKITVIAGDREQAETIIK